VILEQPAAENLELAAGNFLVGGFEQRAQRDQPAEIFVDPVLQHDQFGRGGGLELDPGDAPFPLSDGVSRDQRQQQSGTGCDQCRQVTSMPRRQNAAPRGNITHDVAKLIPVVVHRQLSFDCQHGSRSRGPGPERMIGYRLKICRQGLRRMPSSLDAEVNDVRFVKRPALYPRAGSRRFKHATGN
jgi:hypothetical protein